MNNDRWAGIVRPYDWADVCKLRGKTRIEYTLARLGADSLWEKMNRGPYVAALGASTGNMAVQHVKAGLGAIYVSGWQVAADANLSGQTYPDQSLYPANSVPALVDRINKALLRAEQIDVLENGSSTKDWMVPIVADAEAGFGGPLNAYELMRSMIESGAAAVHFEDQLSSAKKCGHLGGKVLVPTSEFIRTLTAARLAADVMEVPTIIIARTDADSAKLLTSDVDSYDHDYIDASKPRTSEGYYQLCRTGIERSVARALAYAPFADVLWMETSRPDLEQAREFASAVHAKFPGKFLAYNCSPSFNWSSIPARAAATFQVELAQMGYAFQFVTLAGFHSTSMSTFRLANDYAARGMAAYVDLQNEEFAYEKRGYTAVKHQREVGVGYFDAVAEVISGGRSSTLALKESTETEQFDDHRNMPAETR